MADEPKAVGHWRSGGAAPAPTSAGRRSGQKWMGVAAMAALLAANIGAVGWLVFQLAFASGPRPYFVGLWVGPHERPEIPPMAWLDADRSALIEDRVFPNAGPGTEIGDPPTLEVMRNRLEGLANRPRDEAVVVYLSAYAIVDRDRRIQILAADSRPYEEKTQLPLAWILDRLRACPARDKLLVLDVMRAAIDPRDLGGAPDAVGDLLEQALQTGAAPEGPKGRGPMVLAACGPGQVALGSEALRHSVFGYFFHRGLTTDEADANQDGAVSARELADYLGRNVDRWAMRHRGVHQQPVVLGQARGDFLLAEVRPAAAPGLADAEERETAASVAEAETTRSASDARAKKSASNVEGEKSASNVGPAGPARGKGPPAAADAGAPLAATGEAGAYPEWLVRPWAVLENWWKTGDFRVAPRIARYLARESARAELRWRGGEPEGPIRRDLETALNELSGAMKRARDLPRPPAWSVGQAREFGWKSDPALSAALAALLRGRRELLANAREGPKGSSEALAKMTDDALSKFQGKTPLDFAAALIDATEDEALDAAALAFLNELVERSRAVLAPMHPPREIREIEFLSQLARRSSAAAGTWEPETARAAWKTVLIAERANNRPEAMAWARPLLDQASASLHEARVLLLPKAANYASWEQIRAAWSDAHEKYEAVADRQRTIQEGHAAAARALAALAGLVPFMEASPDAGAQADWLATARRCGELARKLGPPPAAPSRDPTSFGDLADSMRRLDAASRRLLAPFGPAAVRAVVEDCLKEPPRPELAARIDAMLLAPLLSVADRVALHESRRALDRRLDKPWRTVETAPSQTTARDVPARERARWRFERMAALLELVGKGPSPPGREAVWDGPGLAEIWAEVARETELAHATFERLLQSEDDGRGDALDRLGWLAPAYAPGLEDWAASPARRAAERAARATWFWLAALYQYEGRDLRGLVGPERARALDRAARECLAVAGPAAPEAGLRIGPLSPVELSPRRTTATVALALVLTGAEAEGRRKVKVETVSPEGDYLEVAPPDPAEPEVATAAPTAVALRLRFSEGRPLSSAPPPSGLVVRARLPNGRVYHALVPLSILAKGAAPALALSRDASHCDDLPMHDLRLRPIAHWRQPFHVFVKNPTDRPRAVTVQLLDGETVVGESGQKPLALAAHSSIAVPSFGAPVPGKEGELREPNGELRLRLYEAGNLIDEAAIRPAIAAPRDFLEIARAEFVPEAPGRPNRLTVELRPRPELAGPPCRVQLVLPIDRDRFPALRQPPKAGKFIDELKPGDSRLTLYAENLVLDPIDETGMFYLNIDGVERAVWFRCRFPRTGGPQPATVTDRPRVTFRAQPRVGPDQPARLDVAFQVDDAPPGSRLDVALGRARAGRAVSELVWNAPAKRRRLGFDPGGEGGTILFEASIRDQVWGPPVPGFVGPRQLRARLIGPSGEEYDSFETELVLDDQTPSAISIQLPDQVARGAPLRVLATAQPPRSKIREVALIFGPKAEFAKAEAENRVFKARRLDGDGRDWTAALPVPNDAPPKLAVTARFTTGVGLNAFITEEVAVVAPPRPEAAKPAAPRRGALAGTVREGNIVQRGLKVYLLDPKSPAGKNPVAAVANTDENGAYSFKDLEPKEYRIYCVKQDGINNRKADGRVTVGPGAALRHDLDLLK